MAAPSVKVAERKGTSVSKEFFLTVWSVRGLEERREQGVGGGGLEVRPPRGLDLCL